MNCPRCNAFIQPGATFCPNCNLQFPQAVPQMQQTYYAPPVVPVAAPESNKEKLYRKLLVIFALLLIGESLFWKLINKLQYEWGWNIGWFTRAIDILTSLAFAGFPLLVGLVLPKTTSIRTVMIIVGGIWLLYRSVTLVYDMFFYSPQPFTYFNF
jgi:hypothetical protein